MEINAGPKWLTLLGGMRKRNDLPKLTAQIANNGLETKKSIFAYYYLIVERLHFAWWTINANYVNWNLQNTLNCKISSLSKNWQKVCKIGESRIYSCIFSGRLPIRKWMYCHSNPPNRWWICSQLAKIIVGLSRKKHWHDSQKCKSYGQSCNTTTYFSAGQFSSRSIHLVTR